jgi:hypothetical protein
MDKVKKIKENLLVEHSVDFIVESHEEVTISIREDGPVYESVVAGEEAKGEVFLKLTGVIQKGNSPNGNRRIYPTKLLARENEKFQSRIRQGTALGKGYHPGFFDLGGPSGLSDVTHRMTRTWMEGDIVRGELIILKTSMGKEEVAPIINGGGKIGISSRGYGSMEHHEKFKIAGKTYKDVFVVQDNYQLETYDLVLTPSVKSAMMRRVKSESQEDGGKDGVNEGDKKGILEGGIKSMTIEELRASQPALYNQIHDAAVKEGKDSGASEMKAQLEGEHKTAVEAKDAEIGSLKESNETLKGENATLKTENADLKGKVEKVEAEKLAGDIKAAVTEAIDKSEYKSYFKEEDITSICSVSETVEAAGNEVAARIGVVKHAIETFKNEHEIVDTKSKKKDTSEDNSSDKSKTAQEAYLKSQRTAAFG